MTHSYPEPVARLLTLGETKILEARDYLKMGFRREHIPDLINLVEDVELRSLPWGENDEVPPEVYAQVHAWRALGQLEATEAIPALIGLLYWIDEDGDDFVGEEVPVVLGKLGAAAIQPCQEYLADRSKGDYARIAAGGALAKIGKQHPETRDDCVQALMSTLENYQADDVTINAFTLSELADLKAVEAAPLAEEIFRAGCADESVMGDYEDFQVEVGLLEKRITPGRGPTDAQVKQLLNAFKNAERTRQQEANKAKKEKAKRKQEKKARRRNRKR
jgi:hypothetical protein